MGVEIDIMSAIQGEEGADGRTLTLPCSHATPHALFRSVSFGDLVDGPETTWKQLTRWNDTPAGTNEAVETSYGDISVMVSAWMERKACSRVGLGLRS